MDKAQTTDVVVNKVRAHLKKSSASNSEALQKEVAKFLNSQKLKKVEVSSRPGARNELRLYLRFSFDGSVIENAIVTKVLNGSH